MNLEALLEHGHRIFLHSTEGFSDEEWEREGVCGKWSAKDVVGHITAMEHWGEEVLSTFAGGGQTPYLEGMSELGADKFLENQVIERRSSPVQATLEEYNEVYQRVLALLPQIPAETMQKVGTLPWYGEIYALDDFLVYSNYAHKREHSAQLAVYRDRLNKA